MKRAIVLVDHGSTRREANDLLVEVARLVGSLAEEDVLVAWAHMEIASPSLEEAFDKCVAAGAQEIIVHPYFLAPGKHSIHDIPRLVREAASRHPGVLYRITEPLGLHTKLAEVVLERVSEARNGGRR